MKNALKGSKFVVKAWVSFKKKGLKAIRYLFTDRKRIMVSKAHARLLNRGCKATIFVKYIDGAHNSGTYENVNDLKWSMNAFITEYLNG